MTKTIKKNTKIKKTTKTTKTTKTIKKGDKIKVEYSGKLQDGTVFDSSKKHGKPLEFEVGAGKVIQGFDTGVIGMKKGEKKEITITPEQGYGQIRKELLKQVPKEQIPSEKPLKAGMVLVVGLPNGNKIPARIAKVGEKEIIIDLNHPLAGKTLIFNIEIVEIN